MRVWAIAAVTLVVGVGALVNLGAQAQTYSGDSDYQVYCSSCHGPEGRGDGVIAKSLKKRPADLTQLARHNGDVFPKERVLKTVDGRRIGHGESDMPAWAEVFAKATESTGEQNAAARIDLLVKYVETLQVK